MAKRLGESGPTDLAATLNSVLGALGVNARTFKRPDGSTSLAIEFGGGGTAPSLLDRTQNWINGPRPDRGTPEERVVRREELFEKLRNIDVPTVIGLAREYFTVFPEHAGRMDMTEASSGAAILGNLEGYIFDPDRMVAMCRALQDAIRQVAATTDGPVNVIEAGFGLGYVAMSGLALNAELGDRVRILGLENSMPVIHRAAQVVDYYGIDPRQIALRPFDARTVQGLKGQDVRILVAEHLAGGVFCQEQLHPIHANLIPQLKAPFFIIPEGLEIYGRVIEAGSHRSSDQIRESVGKRLRGLTGEMPERALGPAEIQALLGQDREIMGQRLLTRLRFADVLNGGWDGNLDLKMQGVAKQGKGILQLRGVPTFHTDEAGKEPFLKPYRLYTGDFGNGEGREDGVMPDICYGTSLNWWGHVRERRRIEEYLASERGQVGQMLDPLGSTMHMMDSLEFSPRLRMERGHHYEISIRGRMDRFFADIRMREIEVQSGGSKGKKKR